MTCACGTPGCGNAGKHPAALWSDLGAGEKLGFDDEQYNVGLATGQRSNCFVVDCDYKPAENKDGFERLRELVAAHKDPWPNTLTVRTPTGGWHFYFRWPGYAVQNSASKIGIGIDVRGDGGYIVLPPSMHKSGKRYEFVGVSEAELTGDWDPDSQIATAPDWLLALIVRSPGADGAPYPIPDVPRPDVLTSSEGWDVLLRTVAGLSKIPAGQRNEILFLEAARIGDWVAAGELNYADAFGAFARAIPTLGWGNEAKSLDTAKNGLDKGSNREVPMIVLGAKNQMINNQAMDALSARDDIYVIGNKLARDTGIEISAMNPDNLEEILSDVVDWRQRSKDGVLAQVHPPDWAVRGIYSRGHWPKLRVVEGHSEVPILRADGSIATQRGYDPHTRTVLSRSWGPPEENLIPATDAAWLFRDLFCDFCFENPAHLASTMAALLTPLSMRAFEGPAPMFMFNASRQAAGKTKLSNACATIATGRPAQLMTFTENEEEMRKSITAQARNPRPLVLMDNIPKDATFGGGALCAALTSPDRMWSDRLLGKNEVFRGKLSWAWYSSGNNCKLGPDMNTRVCPIRLVPKTAHPEFRTGFKHSPFEPWVESNKEAYMWAALSIVSAFIKAGAPAPTGLPWRGFDGWRALIVGAVEWAGFGNLDATRIIHEEDDGSQAVIEGFKAFWEKQGDFTVREAHELCFASFTPEHAKPLRKALDGMYPRGATTVQVGGALRGIKDVYMDGCALTESKLRGPGNVALWTCVKGGI